MAHPDDELLGVGGTAMRMKNEGCDVLNFILGEGRGDYLDNKFDTIPNLDVYEELVP